LKISIKKSLIIKEKLAHLLPYLFYQFNKNAIGVCQQEKYWSVTRALENPSIQFCVIQLFRCFLIKTPVEKKPEICILFFNFSQTFFLKCTCTRTHDNINLFLQETRSIENRKPNYFYLLWRWIILFLFYIYKKFTFSASAKGWVICVDAKKTS
jgi:hypothetical protein